MKYLIFGILLLLFAFQSSQDTSKVEAKTDEGVATLFVDGIEWNMKAVSGFDYLDMAEQAGVNTIRTWGIKNLNNGELLDEAHKRGMKVLVGLWLAHHKKGIDYTSEADSSKRIKQYKRITEEVLKYKDHPAILAWGVGNEVNAKKAPVEVWKAVNDIAAFIHQNDPFHPTVTIIAGSGVHHIENIIERAPEIDILGINCYRGTSEVRKNVTSSGWNKPFMVTELGPDGFWEADTTSWGVPIEVGSCVASQKYIERYNEVSADPLCIGVFPFKWGSAPKKTPTWLSIFTIDGAKTQIYDELFNVWKHKYPVNRAPIVSQLCINNKRAGESVILDAESIATAHVAATDVEGDSLIYRWEILPEIILRKNVQGSEKIKVKAVEGRIIENQDSTIKFRVPSKPGAYRLYTYVKDTNGYTGYENIPFLVRE